MGKKVTTAKVKKPKKEKTAPKAVMPEITLPAAPKKTEPKEDGDKNIRDAQYRKGLSIAFFNATNAAITLCAGMDPKDPKTIDEIVRLRNFFLEEHKVYYASVVAQAGKEYSVEDAVKKLRAVKSLEGLHMVWLMFSEDERRDIEVARVAQEMKKKYAKN